MERLMTGTLTLAAGLVLMSLVLLAWHVRSWRAADHGGLSDRDYHFHRRQFFRRLLASGLLGLIGLLMFGDEWIAHPLTKLAYWSAIAALVLMTMALALADLLASRMHYRRQSADHVAEHALLRAEIERFRREQETGEER